MKNWLAEWRARDLDRDLRDEMRLHMEMRAAEFERQGMSAPDAAAAAHKRFGSTCIVHEDTRRMHLGPVAAGAEGAARELRFALRSLRRSPSFTIAAVLALALGVGAASAVFSVADHILFRGLPYANGDRLVSVGVIAPIAGHAFLLGGDYSEWQEERSAFDGFTSTRGAADCDITETNPVRLSCAQVEWTFLPVLGIEPAAGRNFRPEEDQPGAARVAIISHALWRERYAADPRIGGRRTLLDGAPATIVGVLPAGFEFPTLAKVDILVPQRLDHAVERKRQAVTMVTAFGRLRPGASIAQAKAALDPFFGHFLTTINPEFRKEVRLEVASLSDLLRQHARTVAWALLGSVLCVLFIAWTNVANLWLARAASRGHETCIRAALGAGRAQLMIHHAAEIALLAVAGWVGGLIVAGALLAIFRGAAPQGIIGLQHASLDLRILVFNACALAACTVAFSLLPAGGVLRQGQGTRVTGPRNMRLRSCLVTAQLAISVVLVVSAGLLIHTLRELGSIQLGVRTEGAVTASAVLGQHRYRGSPERYAFIQRLEGGLRRLPGVTAVAVADEIPPLAAGLPFMLGSIGVDGQRPNGQGAGGMVNERHITPQYFQALGIQMLRGRPFAPADMDSTQGAAILSERLARRLFPAQDAIGHTVKPTGWPKTYSVVGVAANVKNAGLLAEDAPEMYLPFDSAQGTSRFVTALVRSAASPDRIAHLVGDEIRAIDPTLPVTVEPYDSRVAQLNERPRFNAMLLSLFALIGLLLAALGVYGVLAFLVSQRVREIGVRMALGATRGRILVWILSYAMSWAAVGIVLGTAAGYAAARQIHSLLYGVTPADPWTFSTVALLLAAVAAFAAYIPARRAATLDPAITLRQE
jgi:predicted permease